MEWKKWQGSNWCWGSALTIHTSPGLRVGRVAGVIPRCFSQRQVYTLHKSPVYRRTTKTQLFTLALTGTDNLEFPVVFVFGLWEEAGEPGENCVQYSELQYNVVHSPIVQCIMSVKGNLLYSILCENSTQKGRKLNSATFLLWGEGADHSAGWRSPHSHCKMLLSKFARQSPGS